MKLYFSGKHNAVTRKELRYAAFFFAEELISSKLMPYIFIKIIVEDESEDMDNTVGSTRWVHDNHNPRIFEVRISPNQNRLNTLGTLAHEMVHVKQYVNGELKQYVMREGWRWKNKVMMDDDEGMYYSKLPWEREAYRKQQKLLVSYMTNLILENKTFDP